MRTERKVTAHQKRRSPRCPASTRGSELPRASLQKLLTIAAGMQAGFPILEIQSFRDGLKHKSEHNLSRDQRDLEKRERNGDRQAHGSDSPIEYRLPIGFAVA